jgi:cytochrome c peroxidase
MVNCINLKLLVPTLGLIYALSAQAEEGQYVFEAGHPSLKEWLLPATPPSPDDNPWTQAKADLGKQLFFDPRLSGTGLVTCASCHFPEFGWEDGLTTAVRFGGTVMQVASSTMVNLGYNTIYMWDGRMPTLEKQAYAGQGIMADINAGMEELGLKEGRHIDRLKAVKGYRSLFANAFPQESAESQISRETIAKAIAAFERTIISNHSPFDAWVNGDKKAMTAQQINGFKVFVGKGNCVSCHSAPNFTDNGFHNLGLKSFADKDHHRGRMNQKPKHASTDGAFKTPTLRDISLRAPYFHDGSAKNLLEVVEHYNRGGEVKTNLSSMLQDSLGLNKDEKFSLIAFMEALTSHSKPFVYPVLPK